MQIEALKKKKRQALKAYDKWKTLKEEVYNNCPCPKDELVSQEKYYEGGYDYHASTSYWDECMICGRKHNAREVTHSWYG